MTNPLKEILIEHEGLRLDRYKCPAGANTVGVGHNLDANPIPGLTFPITREMAMEILEDDIEAATADLHRELPWTKNLDEVRHAVLVDMAFNMGIYGLKLFKNTLAHVKEGMYHAAALNMLDSKWAKQVQKSRVDRLVGMMTTGKWPKGFEPE